MDSLPHSRLKRFYEDRYRLPPGEPPRPPAPVRSRRFPSDRLEMTVALASRNAGGRYLEVGAGAGGTVLAVLDRYEELVVTELSEERASGMRMLFEACSNKVRVICGDIENDDLPFADDYFDTVVMTAVIEHLIDPLEVLARMRSLLKPGGRLLLCTPNIGKWTRRIKLLFGYFPSTASLREGLLCYDRQTEAALLDEGHLHYFTFRSLRRACLERAGFSAVEGHGFGGSFLCRMWPALFSDVFLVARK
jgi:SAM-dependent methyltransferase